MDKGTVFAFRDFVFHNGGSSDLKYLILLNEPSYEGTCLLCKTTSKKKYGLEYEGCYYEKNVFVLNPGPPCFVKKTWVQFDPTSLFEYSYPELLEKYSAHKLHIQGKLSEKTINSIIDCIMRSEDISKHHMLLLFPSEENN